MLCSCAVTRKSSAVQDYCLYNTGVIFKKQALNMDLCEALVYVYRVSPKDVTGMCITLVLLL